jgi:2'-5' RNA ligase
MGIDEDFERRWAPTLRAMPPAVTTAEVHTQAGDAQEDQANADLEFRSANDAWEDAVKAAGGHTGVMVAFYPSKEQQKQLAIEGGEPAHEVHLTLAFLGEVGAELVPADEPRLIEAVAGWAATQAPISAITNGHGIFTSGPTAVTYASIDAPDLPTARQALVEALDKAQLPPMRNHGYTPHMTLAYAELRDVAVPDMTLLFDSVVIAFAGNQTTIPLGPSAPAAQAASVTIGGPSIQYIRDHIIPTLVSTGDPRTTYLGGSYTSGSTFGSIFVSDQPTKHDMSGVPLLVPAATEETAKAFVTEVNGRTLITGPATTIAAMKDPTVEDITEAHMLWMHGRFVGADAPNRNGALWSAGDLEMARGTVVNGPLNWLHDARHVIGTLAQADFVDAATATINASTGGPQRPVEAHITATAAIWKWIYPDEAYVVQQASEQQMLWYSMECISKEVSCVGESGCGNTTTYSAYMAGAACEHVMQRASVRRFVNPVFLGGAVIVPPTRPGWAEADARVMSTANSLAEAAFEQAGRPDVSASAWEQLMGQLVRFTEK